MIDPQAFHLSDDLLRIVRASNEADSTLLITGNTGTGKSRLAQLVHRASVKRANARWFKINLATLSDNLIESELFGHERGAFTGADIRRVGRLESCNGGTVFLDEIGELPVRLQAKLLDFIQYKKITPVGSNREVELDVRIIAATNRDLAAAVKAGDFRADLYHRLNVFSVVLPDLSILPGKALRLAKEKSGKGFEPVVEEIFCKYPWPGNVRELENVVEFACAMERGNRIGAAALPGYFRDYAINELGFELPQTLTEPAPRLPERPEGTAECKTPINDEPSALPFLQSLDYHSSKEMFEKTFLERALRQCNGRINLTSRRTGLNKVSLTDKIRKYGIDWKKIRNDNLGPLLN